MALETSKIQLPRSVVTELSKKVKDTSTIAALMPSSPVIFADQTNMIFNHDSEAEVVGEGKAKGSYEQTLSPVEGKRFKVVTTTRVSDELRWADEDDQLEIVTNIMLDQSGAIGRSLDYVVYHAVNPKSGQILENFTALTSVANIVTATDSETDNIDALTDALIDYEINGIALSRTLASDLRKLRVPATGMRLYPEIPLNLSVGNFDGINSATSGTVNGRLAETATGVRAIMGDFSLIRWGMVRDIFTEMIMYGDPDNTGVDLKAHNQVAFRTEALFSYAVLDADGFAVLKTA